MTQRDDLVSRLRDESVRLSWNSIERGCVDSGIASNVADDAIDMLTDDATALEAKDAEIARLRDGHSVAVADVASERRRQIKFEGWSLAHDDSHCGGEMARAAAAYALGNYRVLITTGGGSRPLRRQETIGALDIWPWSRDWWKPKSPRENLVRAGALIVAEIERLDRIAELERQLAEQGGHDAG